MRTIVPTLTRRPCTGGPNLIALAQSETEVGMSRWVLVLWMALLLGVPLPYDHGVRSQTVAPTNRLGAWTVSVGAAFAAF